MTTIKELRELCEKATPGPLEITSALDDGKPILHAPSAGRVVCQFAYECGDGYGAFDNFENNMRLFAASRTAIPQLLDLIEQMVGALEYARQEYIAKDARITANLNAALSEPEFKPCIQTPFCEALAAYRAMKGEGDET